MVICTGLAALLGAACGDVLAAEQTTSHPTPDFRAALPSALVPAALKPKDAPVVEASDAVPGAASEVARVVPEAAPATARPSLVIDINLSTQRMTVSEAGRSRHTWSISSGKRGFATPTGAFKPSWMARMWYSRQYDYAPMPHAIFFSGGAAIHATYATAMLGQPASHGCVRLAPENAKRLYKMVAAHGKSRTRIDVHGTPRYRAFATVRDRQPIRDTRVIRYHRYQLGSPAHQRSTVRYSPWGY